MSRLVRRIPEGDNRERLVCPDCDFVAYENPKIVVGSVVAEGDRVLLCRRAIDPRSGFWTIPAGYMEMGETVTEGAQREAWEEARARIAIDGVLAVYSISKARDITNVLPAKVNWFQCSYVESVSVGGRLCVLMAISMALNASLASRWRRIIRLITCSARA